MILNLALLVALGLSVDVWTSFVNEEGEEFDATGVELLKLGKERGGNGGSGWTDDCESRGGLDKIKMECGNYPGSFRLHCKKGWRSTHGAGKGNGHGKIETVNVEGVTKMKIRTKQDKQKKNGGYVYKVTYLRNDSKVFSCGSSNSGNEYTASAPAGMVLCGLKGRTGWWTDSLAAGWCTHKIKTSGYIGCYRDNSARDLDKRPSGEYTPTTCKKWCGDNNYLYAGVQWYGECWCGNKYGGGAYTKHEGCNTACKKDPSEMCGGGWHNSIYRTHAKEHKPCPKHCAHKDESLDMDKEKKDFNSHNRGDQIRKWFDGPKCQDAGEKIVGSVEYRDQNWGNKKAGVYFCCNCGSSTQSASNCVTLCGSDVRNWKTCKFDKPTPSSCKQGATTCVAYKVGGGGGHRFYGRKFHAKLKHKGALLSEGQDITFAGEFVSAVDFEEGEVGYSSHVVVGAGGLMVGLAGAFFLRRRQGSF